jgi:hypothetical protein
MADVKATWTVKLDCECPKCGEIFDLTDDPDFYHTYECAEHDTEGTRDVDVVCPKCKHEFKVDFEY